MILYRKSQDKTTHSLIVTQENLAKECGEGSIQIAGNGFINNGDIITLYPVYCATRDFRSNHEFNFKCEKKILCMNRHFEPSRDLASLFSSE